MKNDKSKPQKIKDYSSYDDWKHDQSNTNQKLITALESLIETLAPHFEKTVKWGQGCFVDGKTPKIFIHTESDYVQLGFYNGAELKDSHNQLVGNGKYVRHVKIWKREDVNEEKLSELINQIV